MFFSCKSMAGTHKASIHRLETYDLFFSMFQWHTQTIYFRADPQMFELNSIPHYDGNRKYWCTFLYAFGNTPQRAWVKAVLCPSIRTHTHTYSGSFYTHTRPLLSTHRHCGRVGSFSAPLQPQRSRQGDGLGGR